MKAGFRIRQVKRVARREALAKRRRKNEDKKFWGRSWGRAGKYGLNEGWYGN